MGEGPRTGLPRRPSPEEGDTGALDNPFQRFNSRQHLKLRKRDPSLSLLRLQVKQPATFQN